MQECCLRHRWRPTRLPNPVVLTNRTMTSMVRRLHVVVHLLHREGMVLCMLHERSIMITLSVCCGLCAVAAPRRAAPVSGNCQSAGKIVIVIVTAAVEHREAAPLAAVEGSGTGRLCWPRHGTQLQLCHRISGMAPRHMPMAATVVASLAMVATARLHHVRCCTGMEERCHTWRPPRRTPMACPIHAACMATCLSITTPVAARTTQSSALSKRGLPSIAVYLHGDSQGASRQGGVMKC